MSSLNERKAKVLTHPSQLAHRELPQSVASEGEGEDPGVLEGGRQVCHGDVRTLHGPQVVTCRTTRLHGCWRLAIRATEPSTSESCQEVWRQEDGKKGERGGGRHYISIPIPMRGRCALRYPVIRVTSNVEFLHSTLIFATAVARHG